jgi:hypothetical protein
MATKTAVRVGNYSIYKPRLFENSRGMIGFNLTLVFDGRVIGEASHDGDGMTYNYLFEPEARAQHEDIVTDDLIDKLLEANGL